METAPQTSASAIDADLPARHYSPWQLFWRRLRRRRLAMLGGILLILLYLAALLAGFLAPYSFERQDRQRFFHPPTSVQIEGWRLVVPRYEMQAIGQFNYQPVRD